MNKEREAVFASETILKKSNILIIRSSSRKIIIFRMTKKKIKRQIRIVVVSISFVGQGLSSTPVDNGCPWAAIGHNSRNGL